MQNRSAAHIAAHRTRDAKCDVSHEEMQRRHQALAAAYGDQPAHVVLRREAGSRLLDAEGPLNVIQAFLDHANISTSSRYLRVTQHGLHVALKHYEETRSRGTNVAHATEDVDLSDQRPFGRSFQ